MYAIMLLITQVWCSLTRSRNNTLDPVFVASFAGPTQPTHVRVLPTVVTLPHAPMYQAPDALLEAAQACVTEALRSAALVERTRTQAEWDSIAEQSLTHTAYKIQRVVNLIEQASTGTRLDEIVHLDEKPVQTPVRIEHFASSTARMQAQRAAYAAQGLTARGTVPQPVCTGVTKNGTPCKRKAQTGTTTCSLDHATTDAELALWM
jgi:hypothetical protein